MSDHTAPVAGDPAASAGKTSHSFDTPEGLRALLIRLHESGPGAWACDREASELMRYTAVRYRPLARKYGLDAWHVASAAFEVMLTASARNAGNPWAVVTRAVQLSCVNEVRAAGLLVSPSKVRHTARIAGCHDAIRFGERERLTDYHPAFAVNPATDDEDADSGEDDGRVAAVLSDTLALFVSQGWDAALVADCVPHVVCRLGDLCSRSRAVEVLRRDRTAPVLLVAGIHVAPKMINPTPRGKDRLADMEGGQHRRPRVPAAHAHRQVSPDHLSVRLPSRDFPSLRHERCVRKRSRRKSFLRVDGGIVCR